MRDNESAANPKGRVRAARSGRMISTSPTPRKDPRIAAGAQAILKVCERYVPEAIVASISSSVRRSIPTKVF